MFKSILYLFVALLFSTSIIAQDNSKSYKINTTKSSINWKGEKVVGDHYGNINFQSGEVAFDGKNFVSGKFIVDMNSMTCTDLEGSSAKKLLGHLKSKDFFGVKDYPTSELIIKSSKVDAENDNLHSIEADLIIKGISQPIYIQVKTSKEGDQLVATSEFKVDRTRYGIKYGSGSFIDNLGDKAILDNFTLGIKAVLE